MKSFIALLVIVMGMLPLSALAQSGKQDFNPMDGILQGMEIGRRFDKARAGDYSPNPPYQQPSQQQPPTQSQIDLNQKFQQLRLQQYLDQQQMDRLNRETHQPPYNRR